MTTEPAPVSAPASIATTTDYYGHLGGRRLKAAGLLGLLWGGSIGLHYTPVGPWVGYGLAGLFGFHALRLLTAAAATEPAPLDDSSRADWPTVALLVAAKNEEGVIGRLAEELCSLDYPAEKLQVWIIDDASSDRTPEILAQLQQRLPQLQVLRREEGAKGGKSGALNACWQVSGGEFVAVFDADAQVPRNLLRQVLPQFADPAIGAVQIRKAVSNYDTNFLTRSQRAEMAVDAFFQQQRIAIGGLGELRGNGEVLRRTAVDRCGGFNEETITDDLDLTFRLHLDGWRIGFQLFPAVGEEGVTQWKALWPQRNRWAEGGYQRFLDYWPWLLSGRLGPARTYDMAMFWVTQYFLPTVGIPDFIGAALTGQLPIFGLTGVIMFLLTILGIDRGLVRSEKEDNVGLPGRIGRSVVGFLYMCHWLPVVAWNTHRMAFVPKRFRWVKTDHGHPGEA